MKIFILDDSEERIKFFKENLAHHNLFIARGVITGRQIFEANEPFEWILLDHDLENKVLVDSDDYYTGFQFAKWLENKKINTPIIIDSWNPVGAANMAELNLNTYLAPFGVALFFFLKKNNLLA